MATKEVLTNIYSQYLVPFAINVNVTINRKYPTVAPYFEGASVNNVLVMSGCFILSTLAFAYLVKNILYIKPRKNEPPIVPYWIPYIGSTMTMGIDPIKFYRKNQEKYGDYFTFILLGRRMVTCLGTNGNNFLFNAKVADASAEEAYKGLTVPIFGKGVVYDVHNSILMEQKKWNKKTGIEDIHKATSELIIMTASKCLLGEEVRSKLDETFAQIFHDLDGGFRPINFLFENLPTKANKLRDQAHIKMRSFFLDIMKSRRERGVTDGTDIMQYLTKDCVYKDGKKLSDEEAAHIMIAMLMAGQHTSSTTSAWAFLYLAQSPGLFEKLRQEQIRVLGSLNAPLTFEALKEMTLHDNVVRETLRLRPPILTIIRKVIRDMKIPGTNYVIPKDYYIQAIPVVSACSDEFFENAQTFNPGRWEEFDKSNLVKERNDDLVDYGFGVLHSASAKSPFIPFGAGRHRCIGETFAYLQIKTIIAIFVRTFDLCLINKKFPDIDYTTMIAQPKNPIIEYTRILE
ncbi:8718_t:CDS:2 [Entrophospora sp. SA101]|nr:8718_t:CDS:2 [Entrophospora sp. SA101]CAJ0897429.1 8336_t:CDS:2 [Entrophospora sp. SA101]